MSMSVCMYVCGLYAFWNQVKFEAHAASLMELPLHGEEAMDGPPPPSPPYLLTRAGKIPLSPAGCRLNPRTLTRSKKEFGGEKKTYGQMCGDTQANYRGQCLTWAQSRTIPNYPELSRTIWNTSERFRTVQVSLRFPHPCPQDGSQRTTDRSRDKIACLRRVWVWHILFRRLWNLA